MREAIVLYKGEPAGMLVQYDDGKFSFSYLSDWLQNPSKPAISLGLPKRVKVFHSPYLFPFFYHLLPEGTNREIASKLGKVDAADDFGLLLQVGAYDTIGAVRVVNKNVHESS